MEQAALTRKVEGSNPSVPAKLFVALSSSGRRSDSQSGNRGSIPLRATMKLIYLGLICVIFVLAVSGHIIPMLIVGAVFAYLKLSRPSTKLDNRKQ